MSFTLPAVAPETLQQLNSPSLIIFRDLVKANIDQMIRMAGSASRLRPHCKTHKMAAVVQLLLERGVTRHKAATVAEAEMLAAAGAADVLLAYNPVGPNIGRVIALAKKFPFCRISVTVDHPAPLSQLSRTAAAAGVDIGVMLDVNVGYDRTGISPAVPQALELYLSLAGLAGIYPAGFHVYDGHQRQTLLAERRAAVQAAWTPVQRLRESCESRGVPVPVLVCGGTPTFPVYAEMTDPAIELSPGTCIFHDSGYGTSFPDLPFQPAAAVLTRVISRPAADRVTLDLGNKAIAADPPRGHRVYFPEIPDAVQEIHNEEHLVLVTPEAVRFQPGDALLGIPTHICPTSALYDRVVVLEAGSLVDEWQVTGRNRCLTV